MAQVAAIVDKLLTDVSQAYVPQGYISEMLLPELKVVQKTGKIGKYGLDFLRVLNTVMGGRGGARRIDSLTRSSDTYSVDSHGLEDIVTLDDYANVEQPFDAEKDSVMALMTALWLGKEKGLADALTSTSIITQNVTLSGTSQFSDYTNSDPIGVTNTAKETIRAACGAPPNVALMDWKVANKLRYHPKILEALGFTQNRAGQLSDAELASALSVKKLLVADVMYNSAKEGQSDSLAAVWGKHIVFAVAPDSAAKMQKTLGYRVQLAGQSPRKVYKQSVINPPEAKSIICTDHYDMVLTDVACAYLIKDAVA